MSNEELVSVCVPTFNGSQFLKETLASVATQTYRNIELIISDDDSRDETLEIIEKFKTQVSFPVIVYNHKPNGIGANWNNCIQKSSGKYIKFIFQDDFMEATCIEEMMLAIQQSNKEVCICKRNILIDENYRNKNNINEWLNIFGDLQSSINVIEEDNNKLITKSIFADKRFLMPPYNKIGEPIVGLIARNVFKDVGLYNTSIRQFIDYEFWYRAIKKYDFVFLDKSLVNFRVHFSQTTKVNERNKLDEFPLYLNFLEKNFIGLLNPEIKKKWFSYFSKLKRKIQLRRK